MVRSVINATGFKRVFELARAGRIEEAKNLLRGLQNEFLAVYEENEVLKNQLAEVAKVLDLAENMDFDGQKYWIKDGLAKKGPFCQLCYDRDGLLVHLQEHKNHWECCACKSLYMSARSRNEAGRNKAPNKVAKGPIPLFVK
ncbi:MAG: hypothetical protein PHV85_02420 [Desulfovibrionaceae bacterium]|nr:hypothetical protein [Desulfovibrionaceae bacterium]MDD4951383.1 hypothetical protein [Desulfovibrionaceae bacterium]